MSKMGCYLLSIIGSAILSLTAANQSLCQVSPLPGSNVMISPVGGGNLAPRALVSQDLYQGGACGSLNLFYNNAGALGCYGPSFIGGIITLTPPMALTVAGTSGGIPYFSTGATWASSGALGANLIMLGGGSGAAPTTAAGLGTATQVLHGNAAGAPSFGAIVSADVATVLASPPCIGCTAPGTGAFTAETDTSLTDTGALNITPTGAPGNVNLQKITNDTTIVRAWGYIGNGVSHPLSGVTNFGGINTTGFTLGQWQALLPSATALSNELDGEAVRSYIMAATGPLTVYLPAGTAFFSNPIASCANSISIFGAGSSETILTFNGNTDGWDHCPSVGTNTKIELHNIQFTSTTLTGTNTAIAAKFIASKNAFLDNVFLFNFNNCINFTQGAGSTLNYVWCQNGQSPGTAGLGNGIVMNGTTTFIIRINNTLVQNFDKSYWFHSTNTLPTVGMEDVVLNASACGNARTCVQIDSTDAGYGPYKYNINFMAADAQLNLINAPNVRLLNVYGGDWLADANVGTWTTNTQDMLSLGSKAVDVRLMHMNFADQFGAKTVNSLIHLIGPNTNNVIMEGNEFDTNSITATTNYVIADATTGGVVFKDNLWSVATVPGVPPANAFSTWPGDARSAIFWAYTGEQAAFSAGGVSLVTNTPKTIASVALAAGYWECTGSFNLVPTTGAATIFEGGWSTVTNTMPGIAAGGMFNIIGTFAAGANNVQPLGVSTFALPAGGTIYAVQQATFPNTAAGAFTGNCTRLR